MGCSIVNTAARIIANRLLNIPNPKLNIATVATMAKE